MEFELEVHNIGFLEWRWGLHEIDDAGKRISRRAWGYQPLKIWAIMAGRIKAHQLRNRNKREPYIKKI